MLFQKNCLFPAFDCPFFLPNSLSLVITAVLWLLLLSIDFGVIKQLLLLRGGAFTKIARYAHVFTWLLFGAELLLFAVYRAYRSKRHPAPRRFKMLANFCTRHADVSNCCCCWHSWVSVLRVWTTWEGERSVQKYHTLTCVLARAKIAACHCHSGIVLVVLCWCLVFTTWLLFNHYVEPAGIET